MLSLSTGTKAVIGTLCLLLAGWWLWSYRITQYHGDGKIRDSGVWTYPRYHVELGQIPLFEPGTHQFKLAGLPSEKMTLELVAVGKAEKDRAELTRLKTHIESTLVDDRGRVVCRASGIPSDGIQENAWILTSSDDSAAFYNRSCVDIDIHRSRSYTLGVRMIDVDPDSPRTYLVPILSGGGNELP